MARQQHLKKRPSVQGRTVSTHRARQITARDVEEDRVLERDPLFVLPRTVKNARGQRRKVRPHDIDLCARGCPPWCEARIREEAEARACSPGAEIEASLRAVVESKLKARPPCVNCKHPKHGVKGCGVKLIPGSAVTACTCTKYVPLEIITKDELLPEAAKRWHAMWPLLPPKRLTVTPAQGVPAISGGRYTAHWKVDPFGAPEGAGLLERALAQTATTPGGTRTGIIPALEEVSAKTDPLLSAIRRIGRISDDELRENKNTQVPRELLETIRDICLATFERSRR